MCTCVALSLSLSLSLSCKHLVFLSFDGSETLMKININRVLFDSDQWVYSLGTPVFPFIARDL